MFLVCCGFYLIPHLYFLVLKADYKTGVFKRKLPFWGQLQNVKSYWEASTPKLVSGSRCMRDFSERSWAHQLFLRVKAEEQQSHEIPKSISIPGYVQLPKNTLGMKGQDEILHLGSTTGMK